MANVGVFVDLQNIGSPKCIIPDLQVIVDYARSLGNVLIRRAYLTTIDAAAVQYSRLAGFNAIIIPSRKKSNSVDISMIVDMMDHASRKEIDTIILVSGDGDFEAAVVRLRENGKRVLVIAREGSVSTTLKAASDEFISYDVLTSGLRRIHSEAIASPIRERIMPTPKPSAVNSQA